MNARTEFSLRECVLRSHDDRFALPDLADGGAMRTDADYYSKKTFVALFTGS